MLLVAALCLGSLPALAQVPDPAGWTADDTVAHALASQGMDDVLDARLRSARARVDEATAIAPPSLGLSHEQLLGPDDAAALEFTATVQQEFDPSRWRGRLRQTLPHREAALRSEDRARRLDLATSVRTAFYSVRHRQERLGVLDDWIAQLARGLESVDARRQQGDASLYESKRVQRELDIARARRAREASLMADAWSALEQWTSWPERPALVGPLPPERAAPEPSAELPELARLHALERAFDAELDVWGTPLLRGWTVGAGYRLADQGSTTSHGFVLSLSLPLALWNTDQPRIAHLRAQRAEVHSERVFRQTVAERAERAARERLARARDALDSLPDPASERALTDLVALAFAAGEAPLIEMLDAFTSETELRLARIDLQWETRRAAIALDRRRGIGAPP